MTKAIDIVLRLLDPAEDCALVIQDAWNADCEEFFIGLDLAVNPDLQYHLDKVPGLPEDDAEEGTLTFGQFFQLAMSLARDKPLPEQAVQAVNNAAMSADATEWNLWYRRILLKSLHKHLPMDTIQKELIRLTSE